MNPHRTSRPGVLLNRMHAGQDAVAGSTSATAAASIAGRRPTDFWGRLLRPRGRPG